MLILLVALGFGYLYAITKNSAPSSKRVPAQPVSYQARQNYLQGQAGATPGYGSVGEGSNIILQKQSQLLTDRYAADLQDRISKTFDPQWRMRWFNAYHRAVLQQDVNANRSPSGPVNVDRTVEEVNNDSGQASGFTRTQMTYQQRFTRCHPRQGAGPNATRPIDQLDPGDQTSMQTPLKKNGHRSLIYPRDYGFFRVRDLEREYWDTPGRPFNAGYTYQPMPRPSVPLFEQIIRFFTGSTTPGSGMLPSRSNPNDDTIN